MRSAGIVLSIGQHQATNTCFHARVDLVRMPSASLRLVSDGADLVMAYFDFADPFGQL
jgi:hypothetical protein